MPKPSFHAEWICSFLNPHCTLPTSFNLFPHGAQFPRCLARLTLLLNIQFEHIDPPPRISSCKSSTSNCILFPGSDILCQNRACLLRVFTYETLSVIVNLNLLQHSDTPHFKLKQASCLLTYVHTWGPLHQRHARESWITQSGEDHVLWGEINIYFTSVNSTHLPSPSPIS